MSYLVIDEGIKSIDGKVVKYFHILAILFAFSFILLGVVLGWQLHYSKDIEDFKKVQAEFQESQRQQQIEILNQMKIAGKLDLMMVKINYMFTAGNEKKLKEFEKFLETVEMEKQLREKEKKKRG